MCRVSTQMTGTFASARAPNSHCDNGPETLYSITSSARASSDGWHSETKCQCDIETLSRRIDNVECLVGSIIPN